MVAKIVSISTGLPFHNFFKCISPNARSLLFYAHLFLSPEILPRIFDPCLQTVRSVLQHNASICQQQVFLIPVAVNPHAVKGLEVLDWDQGQGRKDASSMNTVYSFQFPNSIIFEEISPEQRSHSFVLDSK